MLVQRSQITEEMLQHSLNSAKEFAVGCKPNYSAFQRLSRMGLLRSFTAHSATSGTLLGYAVFVEDVVGLINTETRTAQCVTVYSTSQGRKRLTGLILLRYAFSCLKQDGFTKVVLSVPLTVEFGALASRLGLVAEETVYVKEF